MEIKKELEVITWKIIEKVIGVILDAIFYLADMYPKSIFGKFIP